MLDLYVCRTPAEFFENADSDVDDPADTSKGVVGVLDGDGNMHRVVATGTRIFLPEIPDLGVIRTRYPVNPVHDDGNTVWKELQVVKDILLNQQKYSFMMNVRL